MGSRAFNVRCVGSVLQVTQLSRQNQALVSQLWDGKNELSGAVSQIISCKLVGRINMYLQYGPCESFTNLP
jgi:hypothetical protein